MMTISDISIYIILIYCTIPGAFGGLVLFLFSFKKGHYHNNKYIIKVIIEIVGAMITATFISMFISKVHYKVISSFVLGICWSGVIQTIRTKITKLVEAALGENIKLK